MNRFYSSNSALAAYTVLHLFLGCDALMEISASYQAGTVPLNTKYLQHLESQAAEVW